LVHDIKPTLCTALRPWFVLGNFVIPSVCSRYSVMKLSCRRLHKSLLLTGGSVPKPTHVIPGPTSVSGGTPSPSLFPFISFTSYTNILHKICQCLRFASAGGTEKLHESMHCTVKNYNSYHPDGSVRTGIIRRWSPAAFLDIPIDRLQDHQRFLKHRCDTSPIASHHRSSTPSQTGTPRLRMCCALVSDHDPESHASSLARQKLVWLSMRNVFASTL
jgi:hypothetical protein